MDVKHVEVALDAVDCLQIGTRNMQNYDLLREVGRTSKPIILKRAFAATVDEWLQAAEYIAASGNLQIILCERGIRTFETATRFTFDLAGAVHARFETHLPIIADPSHAAGNHRLVTHTPTALCPTGRNR
jgi:3-deoxy-7-phosphoheptulonate synthase